MSDLDNVTEYALSLDSFLNPTVYKGKSAIEILICRLIMLEPGTFETHPEMGVGIGSKFRNMKENELSELDDEITQQMSTYIPSIYGVQVRTKLLSGGRLRIAIKANDELFALTYDSNNSRLNSEKLSLDSFAQ